VPGRWTRLLVGVVAVDLVCALVASGHELDGFVTGRHDLTTWAAAIGLVCSVTVFLLAGLLLRSLLQARRDLHSRTEALAVDASLSTDWLWETDVDSRLTYSSPGVHGLLGYQADELIGRPTFSLLSDGDREVAQDLVRRAVEGSDGWTSTELTWLRADGVEIALRGKAAPIKDEDGVVVGFRGVRRAVTDRERAQRRIEAARTRVDDVVTDRALDVAMQPIVELASGRLVGAEALARFRDGRAPDAWFTEARDSGRSLELDRLAFGSALAALGDLPEGCYISINATPELLGSGHLRSMLSGALPLKRIVIEITEHVQIDDYDALRQAIAPLRDRGVRLAIDDTGAGYASLSHVIRLRPDIIKVDRSLVSHIATDAARRSLVTSLILLAVDLGATVTAEGVETAAELDALSRLGAYAGQGYLLGRPTTDRAAWRDWADMDWHLPDSSVAGPAASGGTR
jgi:PAS domain S-box-containing protein